MIYERNKAVSEDFGITFSYDTMDYNELNSTLATQAGVGTDDYDLYIGHKYSFSTCAQQNYCYNLNNIAALNLEGEWWDRACYEDLTINGRTFLMTGDISPTSMRISSCYVFNKPLMEDLQKSSADLVTAAKEGKWTLDMMLDYTTGVTTNLDGNSQLSYTDDRVGLTAWMMDAPFALFYGAADPFVSIVDDTPTMTYADSTEKVIDIYEKLYKLIIDQQANFATDEALHEASYEVFVEGRALFCDITLAKISAMVVAKNMKDAYGILPVPKYDESQTEYQSFVNGASPFVMISRSESDPEFVGTILEAMATYNYDNVTPNLFEIVTKLQAAQDPDSAAMVDLIVRNRIYDLAYFHDWELSNVILTGLKGSADSIASELTAANKIANKRTLPDLIEAYSEGD